MQFSSLIFAAAAFAVANAAKFTNPSFNSVTAGQTFNITWGDASGPVTLTLKNGDPNHLATVNVIASGLSGGSYAWAVPATLPADTYALQIDDGGPPNYSEQFQLIGGASSSSAASSSSSAAASSTSLPTVSGNSTTTAASSSTTGNSTASATGSSSSGSKTSTSGSRTTTSASTTGSSTGAPTGASAASGLASPLALVFLALAAIMTLN